MIYIYIYIYIYTLYIYVPNLNVYVIPLTLLEIWRVLCWWLLRPSKHSLVREYCVGSCKRSYFPCIWRLFIYMKEKERWKRKKERERTCAKTPTTKLRRTYISTYSLLARRRHLYTLIPIPTNTLDWYIPRCSPRPLATAVYSSPRSFCSLVAASWLTLSRVFARRKVLRLLSYITLPSKEITGRNPKVSVKVKEASCRPAVSFALVTPLFRPWRDTSRVKNTSSCAVKSQYVHVRQVVSCLRASLWKIPSCIRENSP